MKSRFHEAAEVELEEAVEYYDAISPSLGARLSVEIKTATRQIEDFPEASPILDFEVRGKVLIKFPYTLMYIIQDGEIFILAVSHQSRRPNYWMDRRTSFQDE